MAKARVRKPDGRKSNAPADDPIALSPPRGHEAYRRVVQRTPLHHGDASGNLVIQGTSGSLRMIQAYLGIGRESGGGGVRLVSDEKISRTPTLAE
jgi:hypothetical protein